MGGWSRNATLRSVLTFLQLHGEQVQPLHPLLQLVLGRGRHGVHILVAPVVVLVRVGGEDLQEEEQTDQTGSDPDSRSGNVEGWKASIRPC